MNQLDHLFPENAVEPARLDAFPIPLTSMPDGWLNLVEMQILYSLARRGKGPILEVGPWLGRSTTAIAVGIRDGGHRVFDTVDFGITSIPEFEEKLQAKIETLSHNPTVIRSIHAPGGSIALLIENLRRNDLLPYVTSIIRGDVTEVPLRNQYELIFCDAMHNEGEIRAHAPLLNERLAPGGWIVCDDVGDDLLANLVQELIGLEPFFRFLQFGIGRKQSYGSDHERGVSSRKKKDFKDANETTDIGIRDLPNEAVGVQISFEPELGIRRNPPRTLNRLPQLSDWSVGGQFTEILKGLNQPIVIHRKAWEYALCIHGLTTLGLVQPNSRALAIGAGTESPLYYFANNIAKMIATDLYDNPIHEGQPEMLTTPEQFAPFEYRRDHLDVMRMSGDDLQFDDNSFDFVFCLSSIEHFGSRDTQRQSLSEMKRVLRPGGVACIITELILNGGTHNEYFTPAEMEQIFLSDPEFGLVGGEFSARIGKELCAMPVDVRNPEDLKASPHIVLTDGTLLWTSASIFLRKTE